MRFRSSASPASTSGETHAAGSSPADPAWALRGVFLRAGARGAAGFFLAAMSRVLLRPDRYIACFWKNVHIASVAEMSVDVFPRSGNGVPPGHV